MFRRTRYQRGNLNLEPRKRGPAVWVYRWWERDTNGKPIRKKVQIGDADTYSTESAAQAAADALRLTINNVDTALQRCQKLTVAALWEHYCREELLRNELSTQDSYSAYAKNWILPRWGDYPLKTVKTVEVERWLHGTSLAEGSKAKIKCVMSALFSHGVRWELCSYNPISSGVAVGSGGKRGPSIGVRVSGKRRNSPLVLNPEQVKSGLNKLKFREQLLVFLDGALERDVASLGLCGGWIAISNRCRFESRTLSIGDEAGI